MYDGKTIYLDDEDELQGILDKVEKNGEAFIVKTPYTDESGYLTLFIDTVGNKQRQIDLSNEMSNSNLSFIISKTKMNLSRECKRKNLFDRENDIKLI